MSTTVIISLVIFFTCLFFAIKRVVKNFKHQTPDKITLIKGKKEVTISSKNTDEDRRKLAHL